ncbi:site-2 protease family protein [bacterium]|nr:site-2 protease family protein [bacterium]
MNRRLKLGTFLGVGLYIHWSFGLMIAYIAWTAHGDGLAGILYAITLLMGVYLCVTLHEYGHVLAARRFGIGAVDITLLPIGGVARLKSMPRIPWQELVVAVAGPAVNVVIVILLMSGLFTLSDEAVLNAFKQGITSTIFGGGHRSTNARDDRSSFAWSLFHQLRNNIGQCQFDACLVQHASSVSHGWWACISQPASDVPELPASHVDCIPGRSSLCSWHGLHRPELWILDASLYRHLHWICWPR